jgi:hypothetical protein
LSGGGGQGVRRIINHPSFYYHSFSLIHPSFILSFNSFLSSFLLGGIRILKGRERILNGEGDVIIEMNE